MVEVRKKPGESLAAMLRRFSRRVQKSGILIKARENLYYRPPKSEREKKLSALHREKMRHYYEKMRKLGREPNKK